MSDSLVAADEASVHVEVHELKWDVRVGQVVPLNSTGPVFGPCLIPHRSRAERFHSSLCVNFPFLIFLLITEELQSAAHKNLYLSLLFQDGKNISHVYTFYPMS